jgi:WD40 repeat protein
VDRYGKHALAIYRGRTVLVDLQTGASRDMPFHAYTSKGVISPDGRWIASAREEDGEIRVSPTDGGAGYRYLRNEGAVTALAFDPLGRWLITGGVDGTVRFWPMPSGKPLHDLPLSQFIQRLGNLTNIHLRDDRKEDEAPYWLSEFPGWAAPLEW